MKDEPLARNYWTSEIYYDAEMKNYLIYLSTIIPELLSSIACVKTK